MRFIVRLIASALALAAAAYFVDGINLEPAPGRDQAVTLVVVAVIFGVVNAILRPLLRLLSFPLIILTLGLFALVINGFLLLVTGWISEWLDVPFSVDGFWAAVLGSVVISIVTFVINVALPDRYES